MPQTAHIRYSPLEEICALSGQQSHVVLSYSTDMLLLLTSHMLHMCLSACLLQAAMWLSQQVLVLGQMSN